jgi:hypothetical protein
MRDQRRWARYGCAARLPDECYEPSTSDWRYKSRLIMRGAGTKMLSISI